MYSPRIVLLKVVSRYLTNSQFKALIDELTGFKRATNPMFVEILKRNFDFERWRSSPIIKQDFWLYNYFAYEYKGKLKCSGLMRKYIHSAFIYDDAEFFKSAEKLNSKKVPLPKGVTFLRNEEETAKPNNHQFSDKMEPRRN